MDKVYTLTMKVRHEGSLLLGIYKTREGAEDSAMAYMKDSYYSWAPDDNDGRLPMVWSSNMDSSLEICDEEVLP